MFGPDSKHRAITGTVPLAAAVLVIIGLNLAVFGGAGSADFINWDDDVYVYDNPRVKAGLSAEGWRWAWALDTPPYYIPMTWISFMLNAEYAGLNGGVFHLTNVALHTASSLLLFWLFVAVTGQTVRSLLVAALFAVHPLHVEGVMWVAQRKEMLSAFFGLIALLAYRVYVERRDQGCAPVARTWYLAVVLALLLSLLSKPMWLTLPALLLLLDVWPLRRLHLGTRWLLVEKIPIALLCVLVFALNISAFDWDAPQLVKTLDVKPFAAGWGTIPISYAVFLWKTVVPHPLAVPYTSFEQPPSVGAVVASLFIIGSLTLFALRVWRRAPWITAGWLWFLAAAATVLFSFGSGKVTPLADHWTYVPHIGLFAAIAWSLPLCSGTTTGLRRATGIGCTLAVVGLAVVAHGQARHWHDPPSLWAHTIEVTERNHVAHWMWGLYEWDEGHHAAGEWLMREAQRLNPSEPFYVHRLGNMLLEVERTPEAFDEYRRLLDALLAAPDILTTIGITALRKLGPLEAEPFLRRAADLAAASDGGDPAPARFYLWMALVSEDRDADANEVLQQFLLESGGDRAEFCAEALALLKRLASVDPAWSRFRASVGSRCPESEGIAPTSAGGMAQDNP